MYRINKDTYKVYLQNNDLTIKEIRKFYLETGHSCNLNDWRAKIKKMFPELKDKDFIISWKDSSNDEIVISSHEEYIIATEQMPEKNLFVRPCSQKEKIPNSKKESAVHCSVLCDSCDGKIVGFRYKCIQCDDYDLCSQCEAMGKHSQHHMIRMPQPLHWHHSRSLFSHLRKIFKKYGICVNKSGINLNKKNTSDENTSQGIHCSISPWLESYIPYLNSFIDTILEVHNVDPDSSKIHKAERKKESKDNVHENESTSKKFPGEGKKLNDDAKDDKGSMSDVASTASQDSSATKVAADEWTIIDKNDTAEVNQTSSTPSSTNEINSKQFPSSSTAPTAPEEISSTETLYPKLPKEEKVIHHQNPIINEAVETMIKMGFSNQSGLLTYLLGAENGDINKVLEILQPTNM